jgi:hypothetical protein
MPSREASSCLDPQPHPPGFPWNWVLAFVSRGLATCYPEPQISSAASWAMPVALREPLGVFQHAATI